MQREVRDDGDEIRLKWRMAPTLPRRERGDRKDAPGMARNSTLKRVARGNESSHTTFVQSCSPEVSGEFPAQARICGYSNTSNSSYSGRQHGGGLEGQDGHSRSNSGPVSVLQRHLLSPLSSSAKGPRRSLVAPMLPPPSPLSSGATWHWPASPSGGPLGLATGRGNEKTTGDVAIGGGGQGSMPGCLDLNAHDLNSAEGPRSKDSSTCAGKSNPTGTTSPKKRKPNRTKRTMDDGGDGGARHKPWPCGEAPYVNKLNGGGTDEHSDTDVAAEGEGGAVAMEVTNDAPHYAFVALCGRRAKMEDNVAAVPRLVQLPGHGEQPDMTDDDSREKGAEYLHFFGVYDGHGGAEVSVLCAENLHHKFEAHIRRLGASNPNGLSSKETSACSPDSLQAAIGSALVAAFDEIDAEVGGIAPEVSAAQHGKASRADAADVATPAGGKEPLVNDSVGTTAVCAVLSESHLVVVNCGDSRALLGKGGETVILTVDHKASLMGLDSAVAVAAACDSRGL